ncbi:hypothetical protein SprV_0401584900 [Sparganum proliferum]
MQDVLTNHKAKEIQGQDKSSQVLGIFDSKRQHPTNFNMSTLSTNFPRADWFRRSSQDVVQQQSAFKAALIASPTPKSKTYTTTTSLATGDYTPVVSGRHLHHLCYSLRDDGEDYQLS